MKKEIVVRRFLIVVILAVVCFLSSAVAGDALSEIDLASETAWQASADDGVFRPIIVPGGGWNSDKQLAPRLRPLTKKEESGKPLINDPDRPVVVKDHVAYRRDVSVPSEWTGRVIQLEFGGVNFGAEVFIDSKKVGEHVGPNMPFIVDLTGVAQPGRTHRLEVTAYHSRHYNDDKGLCRVPIGFDYEYQRGKRTPDWTSKTAYGIVKYIRLTSLPIVHVRDVVVRTSVTNDTFGFEATVANAGDKPVELKLAAELLSWNKSQYKYPELPSRAVTIPAHGETKVSVEGIRWGLGSQSWWWPNIPFREDYLAQLHLLRLTLEKDGKTIDDQTQRFGFVEHAEGPYYYTVNGVRVNGFGDGTAEPQLSEFDAYAELAAYKAADACRETWRRFMRLGVNANRLHQSTPTDLMLDTADEVGFMLIPETGLRGMHNQGWDPVYLPQAVREMILHARNHPSVVRCSLQNENAFDEAQWRALIDAATETDPMRLLVSEDNNVGRTKLGRFFPLQPTRFEGTHGHAWAMAHYIDYPKPCRGGIFGLGEMSWGNGVLPKYAVQIRFWRLNDVAYFAPWSWLNYWPNLLEGGSHAKHGWKYNNDPDRVDGVDGWNSPIIEFVKRSQHPYLIQDLAVLADNPSALRQPVGEMNWPYKRFASVAAGKTVARDIEVFNGGLFGNKLALVWSAHWDKPDGPVAVAGGEIPCVIEPGFHATQKLTFTIPNPGMDKRDMYVILESHKDGQLVFRETGMCLSVLAKSKDKSK